MLIAGEKIEAGDPVHFGADGRLYARPNALKDVEIVRDPHVPTGQVWKDGEKTYLNVGDPGRAD